MAAHWAPSSMVHRIAHRGASHYAPANSPEAVAAAAQHGATDVEVDVHSCADGRLVVTHDGTVQAGGARWISQLTSSDYAAALDEVGEQPVDDATALMRANVDGICADDPEVLVEAQRQVGSG